MGSEECWVIAKYDYQAQGSHELGLRKSERLLLIDDSKHWWRVMNCRQQIGYVPSNYVKKEKPSLFDSIKKRVKKNGGVGSRTLPSGGGGESQPASPCTGHSTSQTLPRLVDPSEAIGVALVKYNYQAQQRDELSLTKGAKVLILEKSNDGWWKGQSNTQVGWFPSNYTQEEEVDDQMHVYTTADNGGNPETIVALYSFSGTEPQELSFTKHEQLEVVDRPANDPEWILARNSAGATGLVPRNYVQEQKQDPHPLPLPPPAAPNGSGSASPAAAVTTQLSQLSVATPGGSGWYYGPLSRAQADALLTAHGQFGDFLVRDSETNVGDYSVSLSAAGRNKHFRVEVKGAIYCIGQRKFHTLEQLVDHYQRCPIYTNPQGDKLYLIRPLPRN